MCILQINGVADEGLSELTERKRLACENKYAKMASEDNTEVANGLWKLMHTVKDWAMINELKTVRKVKSGRHRLYITGRYSQCQYTVVFMLVNKRVEDDKPEDKAFQKRVIRALSDPQRRLIPFNENAAVEIEEDEEEINLRSRS